MGGVAGGGAKPRRKECLTARKGGVTRLAATLMAPYMGYEASCSSLHLSSEFLALERWEYFLRPCSTVNGVLVPPRDAQRACDLCLCAWRECGSYDNGGEIKRQTEGTKRVPLPVSVDKGRQPPVPEGGL